MPTGSRETAFIHAITSAGVVHAASRSCSMGQLGKCSCKNRRTQKPPPRGWQWGGCNDNIQFGVWVSEQFVDAAERVGDRSRNRSRRKSRLLTAMNLHNNAVGRAVSLALLLVSYLYSSALAVDRRGNLLINLGSSVWSLPRSSYIWFRLKPTIFQTSRNSLFAEYRVGPNHQLFVVLTVKWSIFSFGSCGGGGGA